MRRGNHERARRRMVNEQLRGRGIRDERVLQAMAAVPRHEFVPVEMQSAAYSDAPLPIGSGQTISQPYIVAYMTQMLGVAADDRVLEIGTGSGYQAAILSLLAGEVYTVERIPELAEAAKDRLQRLGYDNVRIVQSDGGLGLPEHAPYDCIIVTAAAPRAPEPLKEQLNDGGRLIVPSGSRHGQILERWRRNADELEQEQLVPVAFVPLLGEQGWSSAAGADDAG